MKQTPQLLHTLALTVAMLAVFASTAQAQWTGSGTSAADPYLISTVDHLKTLASNVNAGSSYTGRFFRLTADLDLAGNASNQWTAIGTIAKSFKGTFDGGGHTIGGLYIESSSSYQGLFGYIDHATVRNFTLTAPTVKASGDVGAAVGGTFVAHIEAIRIVGGTLSSNGDVGGVVGYLSSSTATACLSSITSLGSTGDRGSLVGHNFNGNVYYGYYTAIIGFYGVGRGITGNTNGVTAKTTAQMNDPAAITALNAALSPGNSYRYVANPNTDEMPLLTTLTSSVAAVDDTSALRLSTENGAIVVDGLQSNSPCTVYTLDGRVIETRQATSETQVIPVPAGIYLVRTPHAAGKVIVP